jgi:hypothetical protein
MNLYPGGRDWDGANYVYSLDDLALAQSMALAMETEMEALFAAVKGQPLPANGKEGRMILFVSIARGVLKYLTDNEAGNVIAETALGHTHAVHFNINLDHT